MTISNFLDNMNGDIGYVYMNGDIGKLQTGAVYPATPESLGSSVVGGTVVSSSGSTTIDYSVMNGNSTTNELMLDPNMGGIEPTAQHNIGLGGAVGVTYAPVDGADGNSMNSDTPLANMPLDQLKSMLSSQLEYYFSRENLANDTYLLSQMDNDQYVPIWTVANFNQVKKLTKDIKLITEVLRESPNVQVDEEGQKVRPNHKRCIVILREIPDNTPLEEVKNLFSGEGCPRLISCEFAHNSSWYVTFESDEDAQKAYRFLREEVKEFQGNPIMARIKAKPMNSRLPIPAVPAVPGVMKNGYRTPPPPPPPVYDPSNYQPGQQRFLYTNGTTMPQTPMQPFTNQVHVYHQPFYPSMMHWGPASPAYFDMSTGVFTMNGLTPHNSFKPHPRSFNQRQSRKQHRSNSDRSDRFVIDSNSNTLVLQMGGSSSGSGSGRTNHQSKNNNNNSGGSSGAINNTNININNTTSNTILPVQQMTNSTLSSSSSSSSTSSSTASSTTTTTKQASTNYQTGTKYHSSHNVGTSTSITSLQQQQQSQHQHQQQQPHHHHHHHHHQQQPQQQQQQVPISETTSYNTIVHDTTRKNLQTSIISHDNDNNTNLIDSNPIQQYSRHRINRRTKEHDTIGQIKSSNNNNHNNNNNNSNNNNNNNSQNTTTTTITTTTASSSSSSSSSLLSSNSSPGSVITSSTTIPTTTTTTTTAASTVNTVSNITAQQYSSRSAVQFDLAASAFPPLPGDKVHNTPTINDQPTSVDCQVLQSSTNRLSDVVKGTAKLKGTKDNKDTSSSSSSSSSSTTCIGQQQVTSRSTSPGNIVVAASTVAPAAATAAVVSTTTTTAASIVSGGAISFVAAVGGGGGVSSSSSTTTTTILNEHNTIGNTSVVSTGGAILSTKSNDTTDHALGTLTPPSSPNKSIKTDDTSSSSMVNGVDEATSTNDGLDDNPTIARCDCDKNSTVQNPQSHGGGAAASTFPSDLNRPSYAQVAQHCRESNCTKHKTLDKDANE